jgi:hypothetical protein
LPADTRLLVRYGGNSEGEAFQLGEKPDPQAVFCEVLEEGSGNEAGAGGQAGSSGRPEIGGVALLSCRLYTQGPASLDVTATGYLPVEDRDLTLDDELCGVAVEIQLSPMVEADP